MQYNKKPHKKSSTLAKLFAKNLKNSQGVLTVKAGYNDLNYL